MSTRRSDIALPVREVRLAKLKTKSGEPVVVRCEAVSEDALQEAIATLDLAHAAQSLPGAHPPAPKKNGKAEDSKKVVAKALKYAEPVIEVGCWITDDDGRDAPAFCFCGEHPDRIPGRLLGAADKMALFQAVMEVGGYAGGAVEAARFPDDAGGGAAGAGAAPGGERLRKDPVRDAAAKPG